MSKITSNELKREVVVLYKKILTLHRKKLNEEMRLFGDFFVKSEFRMNYLSADNNQIKLFIKQWKDYQIQLNSEKIVDIKPDAGLKTRMDIDQMKSLKEIQTLIEDISLKKK
jgi:hypothetical protein